MGLPDKSTYADYGGEKQDYSAPEDPTTDRGAAELDPALADTAAMTRMIDRCYVAFSVGAGPGFTITVLEHEAVWGNGVSVLPVVTRIALGNYTVRWPATVTDARSASIAPNLRRGRGNVEAVGWTVGVVRLSPNSVRVYLGSLAAAGAADPIGPAVVVEAW